MIITALFYLKVVHCQMLLCKVKSGSHTMFCTIFIVQFVWIVGDPGSENMKNIFNRLKQVTDFFYY